MDLGVCSMFWMMNILIYYLTMLTAHPHYVSGQNGERKFIIVQHVFSTGKVDTNNGDTTNNNGNGNSAYNTGSNQFHNKYGRQNSAWHGSNVGNGHGGHDSVWNEHSGNQFGNNHKGHNSDWNGHNVGNGHGGHSSSWSGNNLNQFGNNHGGNKSTWNGHNANQFGYSHVSHKSAWNGENGNDASDRVFTIQHIFRTPLQYAFVTKDLNKIISGSQTWQKPRLFKKSWTGDESTKNNNNDNSAWNQRSYDNSGHTTNGDNGWELGKHTKNGNGWPSTIGNGWSSTNGNGWPSTNGNGWPSTNGNGWPSTSGNSWASIHGNGWPSDNGNTWTPTKGTNTDNSRHSYVINSDHSKTLSGQSAGHSKRATKGQNSNKPTARYGWIRLVPQQTKTSNRKWQQHEHHNNIGSSQHNNGWTQQSNHGSTASGVGAFRWTLFPLKSPNHANSAWMQQNKAGSGQKWVSGPWNPQDNINPELTVRWYDDNRHRKPHAIKSTSNYKPEIA